MEIKNQAIKTLDWVDKRIEQAQMFGGKFLDLSWPRKIGAEKLRKIPSRVFKMSELRMLDISYNAFEDIPEDISKLKNLRTLSCTKNNFSNLPIGIFGLQNLSSLYFDNNQLQSIPNSIEKLQGLEELFLDNNLFKEIPSTIIGLRNLVTLSLKGNKIERIPISVVNMYKLQDIRLSGNPLLTPPPEVAEKGVIAIREYLRQLSGGQDHLYEAKLLIIGEGGAGKTSLAEKIKNPLYKLQDEPSTEGIEVIQWNFKFDEDKIFRVNVWDFGGQEIYHTTHQFFLTKRSLYSLVADTRKDDTDFFYWLNVVDLLGDGSPLLIIKNEKQDRHREINERQLRGHFDCLKEVLATNLATNRGLENVVSEIKHYITKLPHVGATLPQTWIRVREILESDSRNYISLEEYLTICKENGFDDINDGLQLSGYFHDIGVFLHFQDDPLLRKTIILKPEWGTAAVYKVLDNRDVIRNLGKFTSSDLTNIWNSNEYLDMHHELIQLMMKFQLCYRIPNSNDTFIAPQLLTENQPEYEWDVQNNLYLRYTYDFMPKGIITRFIVAMHPYIMKQNFLWKSGVILEKENSYAEVIEHYEKKEIRIRISGKHNKELMTIIMHELDKIHLTYKKLKYDKLIPCSCSYCHKATEPHFYRYDQLQRFIEKDLEDIQCGASGNMVHIGNLLERVLNRTIVIEKNGDSFMTKYEVHIGAGAKVDGPIVIGSEIKNGFIRQSYEKAAAANISEELRTTLQLLAFAVDEMNKELSEKDATKTANNLAEIVEASTQGFSDSKWYEVSLEGLIKAAENLGRIGKPVLELAWKLTEIIMLTQK